MPANMKGGPDDRMRARTSDASKTAGSNPVFSKDKSKEGNALRSHATLSMWAAALILCGILVYGLHQIRRGLEDMQGWLQQLAQDNKLLLEGLDEILVRTEPSGRETEAEFSPPTLSNENERNEADEGEPEDTARRYKIYYRTKKGEGLAAISEKFNVSQDQLRLWNALEENESLIPGQVLVINKSTHPPKTTEEGSASPAPDAQSLAKRQASDVEHPGSEKPVSDPALRAGAKGDEAGKEETRVVSPNPVEGIADSSGVEEKEAGTGMAEPAAEEPAGATAETVLPTTDTTHRVQEGENLYRIGRTYDVSWRRIAAANGITNPTRIYVGQVLKIPAAKGSAPEP